MRLEGWGEIAQRLTRLLRVEVSPYQARYWAGRQIDPVPVERIKRAGRPLIVAEEEALEAWAQREVVTVH